MEIRDMVLELMDLPDELRPTTYGGMISTLQARNGQKDGNKVDPVQMAKLLGITIPGSEAWKGEGKFMDSIVLTGDYIVEKKDLGHHQTFTGAPEPIRETEIVIQDLEVEIPVVRNFNAEELMLIDRDTLIKLTETQSVREGRAIVLKDKITKAEIIDLLIRPDLT